MKKLIILILLLLFILFIFSIGSVILKTQSFEIKNITCNGKYNNLTVCEYDAFIPTGFYEDKKIYIQRGYYFKTITLKHEYCHYIQDVVRNESIGLIQEFECYIKGVV